MQQSGRRRTLWKTTLCTLAGALALSLLPTRAQATPFELIYSGVFNTQNALNLASQSTPTYFGAATPFTIRAFFDNTSPNLAPPLPPPTPFAGFRAYSPSWVAIDIGGQTFAMDTFTANPIAGVTIAVFDQNSFTPGRYGIGILQQPPQDGAGIVADFVGASPGFTVNTLSSTTTFTGYAGVGYGSGVCLQGTPGNCQQNAVTPFVLRDTSNRVWALTLGNFEEAYAGGPDAGRTGTIPGPPNQAQLVATPEPATFGAASAAFALLFSIVRRQRRPL